MAQRDSYEAPRRRIEIMGPLIRWTIMLVLGVVGVSLAYTVMNTDVEPVGPPQTAQQEALGSRYASTEPGVATDATNIDSAQTEPVAAPQAEPAPPPQRQARTAPRTRVAPRPAPADESLNEAAPPQPLTPVTPAAPPPPAVTPVPEPVTPPAPM